MRRLTWVFLLLGFSCLLGSNCGGGGGGGIGGVTVSDLGGTWLGPTGTATPGGALAAPATSGGMTVDGIGGMVGSGALASSTGTFVLVDPLVRLFRWFGSGLSAGLNGIALMSSDRNHLLLVLSDGTLAALERDATMLLPAYLDAEFRNAAWRGYATRVDPSFLPIDAEEVSVTIDATGNFFAGSSSTNVAPLSILDPNTGEIRGDYTDPGPPAEFGNLLLLITPDRQFMAVHSCDLGAVVLSDCDWVGLERN